MLLYMLLVDSYAVMLQRQAITDIRFAAGGKLRIYCNVDDSRCKACACHS